MTVRELMKRLIELDPEIRVGVNAHSGGCAIEHITVYVETGKPNHIEWKASHSKRPLPSVDCDFAFDLSGDPIVVISG